MRQDGNEGLWQIPEGDRECLVSPPITDWRSIAGANRQLNQGHSAHRQIVAGALAYTRDVLNEHIEVTKNPDALVLVTGHQPRFYHPGVWCKNYVLTQAAARIGAVPINLIVDTDEVGTLEAAVPVFNRRWEHTLVPLLSAEARETFEDLLPPRRSQVHEFAAKLAKSAANGFAPETKANLERFLALLGEGDLPDSPSLGLAGWLTWLRRRYEGEGRPYLELPVSYLTELVEFKAFAADIIDDAPVFTAQYNATLARYRHAHGYRYQANPFPDLHRDETAGEYELPFWVMRDTKRHPIYIKHSQGRWSLHIGGENIISGDGRVTGEHLAELRLRPRGMTLTLFMRLFGADLFLHGIGGAKYDGATSWFIRDYYGQAPPKYAGATLTLFPHLEVSAVSPEEVRELEELLRDVEYNPDRHLSEASLSERERQNLRGLVDRKETMIAQIRQAGANRKEIGFAIKEVNHEIALALNDYREQVRARLIEKRGQLAGTEQARRRDYAYFLFAPGDIDQQLPVC